MNEEIRVEEEVVNEVEEVTEVEATAVDEIFTGVAINGQEPNTLGYAVGILGLVGLTIASYEGGKFLAKKSISFIEKKRNEKKLKNYKKELEEQEDSKNEK